MSGRQRERELASFSVLKKKQSPRYGGEIVWGIKHLKKNSATYRPHRQYVFEKKQILMDLEDMCPLASLNVLDFDSLCYEGLGNCRSRSRGLKGLKALGL